MQVTINVNLLRTYTTLILNRDSTSGIAITFIPSDLSYVKHEIWRLNLAGESNHGQFIGVVRYRNTIYYFIIIVQAVLPQTHPK